MKRKFKWFLFCIPFLFSLFSCSDFAVSKTGTAGNKCFENSTCLNDLTCQEGICVDLISDNKCTKGEIKWVTCPTDLEKVLKQTCDSKGEWISSDECEPCQEGIEKDAVCESDVSKLQKQVCDSNAHWIDKGECFDPNADEENDEDVIDSGDTGDTEDSGNSGDTGNTGNTGNSGNSGNTRVVPCTNKLPEKATWKPEYSDGQIEQTWNGSEWTPGADSCEWECNEGYVANENSCVVCIEDQIRYVECSTDPSKWQKQICDGNETWQYDGECCDPKTTILCTGQDKCYNEADEITCLGSGDFYGQDAQYAQQGYCIPRSYTVSGIEPEEIVTDNNTGLQWQRTPPTTYNGCTGGDPVGSTCLWQEAIDYCDELSYGGHSDWRLPTRKELATMVDYGKYEPAVDTNYFLYTQNNYYWTFTTAQGNSDNAWHVSFTEGFCSNISKNKFHYSRCVRGDEWDMGSNFEEIEINGKTIVTDTKTGLVWTKAFVSNTWKYALDYCETLSYGGYTDWRLPNIEELKTLINDTKMSPASSFPGILSVRFWSSSSNGGSGLALDINFSEGTVYNYNKRKYQYALCVR